MVPRSGFPPRITNLSIMPVRVSLFPTQAKAALVHPVNEDLFTGTPEWATLSVKRAAGGRCAYFDTGSVLASSQRANSSSESLRAARSWEMERKMRCFFLRFSFVLLGLGGGCGCSSDKTKDIALCQPFSIT